MTRQERVVHPRNRYAEAPPDFAKLAARYPSFAPFVRVNHRGRGSIDWTDYNATRELTRILLESDYGVKWWIPDGHLVPTVTNRANYIHWIEDLLREFPRPEKPTGARVSGVDIGTGASCIYPLLGASLLGWKFVGTDITQVALEWAKKNVEDNPQLQELIEVRTAARKESLDNKVEDKEDVEPKILVGVLEDDEEFDFCMCNPPFFESMAEAGLNPRTACGGTPEEMACVGGEAGFVSRLITDSLQLRTRIHWYTTMVGKKASLKALTSQIRLSGASMLKTTEFVQGRTSRWGLAWTFSKVPDQAGASRVFQGRNDGTFSFILDGIDRQRSALDILQSLVSNLEGHGATCQVDTGSFTIAGAFPDAENVVKKRTSDGVLVTSQERNQVSPSSSNFKVTLFQQSPGCLLVKASVSKREGSSSASCRLLSVLESAEAALKEQFTSRVRQKV